MIYQNDAEILYPESVTPSLRKLRGQGWEELVERVLSSPEDDDTRVAFGLMMIRLDGCLTCHADSYRAMRGCSACAQQTIRRFKGSDEQLSAAFDVALKDIGHWRETGEVPPGEQDASVIQ